jgi:hypothetical protein
LTGRPEAGYRCIAGVLAVVGLRFLTGVIGTERIWSPTDLAASFYAPVVVPSSTSLRSPLAAWPARRRGCFGSRGRQVGAYLLIGTNTFSILAILGTAWLVVGAVCNPRRAIRISDRTAVFPTDDEPVEYGDTDRIFGTPESQRVEDSITDEFGRAVPRSLLAGRNAHLL